MGSPAAPTGISRAQFEAAFLGFDTIFQQAYAKVTPWWQRVAGLMPSDDAGQVHLWLSSLPTVREWIGDRVLHQLGANGYTLLNRDFELSFAVARNAILDDKLGLYTPAFQMMGMQFAKWPDQRIAVDLLKGYATAGNCFDGKLFFATDHPVDPHDASKGTYANKLTTSALTAANYKTARAAFRKIKRPDGEPMGLSPNLLIVPPDLEFDARQIVEGEILTTVFGSNTAAAAQSNVYKGTAQVMVIPELAGEDTTWYLACTDLPLLPLIFQDRQAPVFVSRTDPASDAVFSRKQYEFGADARGAFGYGLPFLMMRCEA
jgi:phage major head subunit gpT-like protein